jgi:N-acetylmuramic acid 6-phosphate (MurNAc-6-P) etherase
MRTIETTVYTIDEHPNPEKCFEWIRSNWHDLNDHSAAEAVGSIKALSEAIGGSVDYVISAVASQGEFIRFRDYSHEELMALDADSCPLTGVCWDADLIRGLISGEPENMLHSLHADTEYVYSDEGLRDLCEANRYEFTEDGKFL